MVNRIGRMRHRLSFETASGGDDWSDTALSWAEDFEVYGEITPRSAAERNQGDRVSQLSQYEIRVRYRSDIVETQRIVHGSQVLAIEGIVNVDQLDEWLLIDASDHGDSV